MSGSGYIIGYGNGEIEPKIAPLVDAVRQAGFVTFSSCEGHVEAPADPCAFTSVAFYAHEDEAKRVHEIFLRYRGRLACSWIFRGGFVLPKRANEFILGWTLENCGIMESVEPADFVSRTVQAGWDTDIPILIEMFADIASHRTAD